MMKGRERKGGISVALLLSCLFHESLKYPVNLLFHVQYGILFSNRRFHTDEQSLSHSVLIHPHIVFLGSAAGLCGTLCHMTDFLHILLQSHTQSFPPGFQS